MTSTTGRAADTPVGLVVVSHSRALGEAAVALAREMLHGPAGAAVRIEVAAGLDDGGFGTDATAIAEALTRSDGSRGVVVLMDLGSAVLSAELALELVDEGLRDRVLLCPAPLVEGLVAAAVAAAGGADREGVAAEAVAGASAKQTQLGHDHREWTDTRAERSSRSTPGDHGSTLFVVTPEHGLHARPAALLVHAVAGFDAHVELVDRTNGRGPVPAGSLTRVAALGAERGHEIEVRASGPDAGAAVDAVLALARTGFGEGARAVQGGGEGSSGSAVVPGPVDAVGAGGTAPLGTVAATGSRPLSGPIAVHAASPGIVVGVALVERPVALAVPDEPAELPAIEHDRLRRALVATRSAVAATRDSVSGADAAIFDAHLLVLADPALLDDARARVDRGESAPAAWVGAVRAAEAGLAALPGEYQRARAADVRALGEQVLAALLGHDAAPGAIPDAATRAGPPVVLVAADLTPARAAALSRGAVGGVVLGGGSATSHAAILLRAKGIPAVMGAGGGVLDLSDGVAIALDGTTGRLVIDPADEVRAELAERHLRRTERATAARDRVAEPARTRDGTSVLVGVNVGTEPEPAPGADLAGLVRTEFLFLGRPQAPDVEEQEAAYRAVAEALGGRRIVLRTLDVGGDKPLPYVAGPVEANPFLGVRGLRLALRRPELLADQLRAIVRTAHATPVGVMFPMVSVPGELHAALALLDDAVAAEGRGRPDGLEVGIMVEVPAAALKAAAFAPHVDFLSIGTNDLTQYALAAERGSAELAELADPLDPGVLRLIDATCRGAGGALVAVCGELAADPRAAGLLVGLGVRELSVAPPAVALVKQAVREVDRGEAADLAARALVAPDADAVRALLPEE